VVSGKMIREHPEIVEQVLRTHIKATDYNLNHLDEAAQIFSETTGTNLADVQLSLKEWDGAWVSDPNLIVEPVLDYANIQYDLGYIKQPLSKDQIFDLSFYKKVTQG
jgi:NitT/TauT family transport system substrate-binding protein